MGEGKAISLALLHLRPPKLTGNPACLHTSPSGLGHFGRGHLGRGHYSRGHLGWGHYGRGQFGRGHLGRGSFWSVDLKDII